MPISSVFPVYISIFELSYVGVRARPGSPYLCPKCRSVEAGHTSSIPPRSGAGHPHVRHLPVTVRSRSVLGPYPAWDHTNWPMASRTWGKGSAGSWLSRAGRAHQPPPLCAPGPGPPAPCAPGRWTDPPALRPRRWISEARLTGSTRTPARRSHPACGRTARTPPRPTAHPACCRRHTAASPAGLFPGSEVISAK